MKTDIQSWPHLIYYGSSIGLALWSLAVGVLFAISSDVGLVGLTMALPGIAIGLGLFAERKKPFPAVLVVLGAGGFIGAATVWVVFAPILAALLFLSRFWISRSKVLQRQAKR